VEVEVRLKGYIDRDWSDWLKTTAVSHTPQGETLLTGRILDQSALYGLLSRLSSLGLHLVSVKCIDPSMNITGGE